MLGYEVVISSPLCHESL